MLKNFFFAINSQRGITGSSASSKTFLRATSPASIPPIMGPTKRKADPGQSAKKEKDNSTDRSAKRQRKSDATAGTTASLPSRLR